VSRGSCIIECKPGSCHPYPHSHPLHTMPHHPYHPTSTVPSHVSTWTSGDRERHAWFQVAFDLALWKRNLPCKHPHTLQT
jgi:hypothetical protein